jgi:hypothetical protein
LAELQSHLSDITAIDVFDLQPRRFGSFLPRSSSAMTDEESPISM